MAVHAVAGAELASEVRAVRTALSVLDGQDPDHLPRLTAAMDSSAVGVRLDAAARQAESVRARRQERWVQERHSP